ncbi:MAG: hypothetical protein OEZ22_08215 [Spirochaetia bacterium]|nr:hypothetical protein [Spirochaetia bacterium]
MKKNKYTYHKKIFIQFFFIFLYFFTNSLSLANSWPLINTIPIETHWGSWKNNFYAIENEALVLYDLSDEKNIINKKLFYFTYKPDIIKHFPIVKGDLIFAVSNTAKQIIFLAFDKSNKIIYQAEYSIDYEILKADVRIDLKGNPVCAFYYKNKNNHVISLFKDEKNTEIYITEHPIEALFLEWNVKKIHAILRTSSRFTWAIWQDGNMTLHQLPSHIMKPQYFSWNNILYLSGIDGSGRLWRFWYDKNLKYIDEYQNNNLRFADEFVPIVHENSFFLLFPSSKTNNIYKLEYIDYANRKIKGKLQEKKLFWNKTIHPLWLNKKISILTETEFHHLYKTNWDETTAFIYNISWEINTQKNPASLRIWWQTNPENKKFAYRYLLDQKEDSEPVAEDRILTKNELTFDNLKDGFYGFHIQLTVPETGYLSPLYHLPIYWKYQPEEPRILLLNQVAQDVVPQGKLKFVFTNPEPVNYYAEISSKPRDEPNEPLKVLNGIAEINKNLKPGKYYLHLKAQDKRSLQYSSTLHYLFFIDPFNPANEPSLRENTELLMQIQFIRQKIREHKNNADELKKYRKMLKEIESKLSKNK